MEQAELNQWATPGAGSPPAPDGGWSEAQWEALQRAVMTRARAAGCDAAAERLVVRAARRVMRRYTTSFFMVSRFLPRPKRDQVELIYAAVRYPDEVVDTFPLAPGEREARLEAWSAAYELALAAPSLRAALADGATPFAAAFAQVVRRHEIPSGHYRAFLAAMRRDVAPRPFPTLASLIDDYIHGSAIVVGFFLAYVYGPSSPGRMGEALAAARDLGIALQLTNFLRDVGEDHRRGRLYLPLDMLARAGVDPADITAPALRPAAIAVVRELAGVAAAHYARADAHLDAYAPDCRVAIKACIDVYGRLNARIAACPDPIARRQSVPLREKLASLPHSKYWRLPLALIGA